MLWPSAHELESVYLGCEPGSDVEPSLAEQVRGAGSLINSNQ